MKNKNHHVNGIIILLALSLVSCAKKDDNKKSLLIGALAYLNSNRSTSSYTNSVTGSSASVQGSTGASNGVSNATSNATSGATTALANLVSAEKSNLAKSVGEKVAATTKAYTCDGTTRNISGTYTTASTVSVSTSTSTSTSSNSTGLISGSYTVTPNLTMKGTYSCPSSNTSSTSTTYTSSTNYTVTEALQ